MSDLTPCDTFDRILRNLNLCDNEQLDKQDEFSKLRPVINELNKRFSFHGKSKSMGESIIPHSGTQNRVLKGHLFSMGIRRKRCSAADGILTSNC